MCVLDDRVGGEKMNFEDSLPNLIYFVCVKGKNMTFMYICFSSNSEERPCAVTGETSQCVDSVDSIRRVSSHEDFSKTRNKIEIQVGSYGKVFVPIHNKVKTHNY